MNTEKCKALILLVIVLLSLFHFGLAAQGYIYYSRLPPQNNGVNYEFKNYFHIFLFIVIVGGIQLITTFILMVQIYNNYWSSYGRYVLTSIDLLATFSLSVVISLFASRVTIRRQYNYTTGKGNDDFQTLYQLSIADAALTFAVQFLYLLILYGSTLEDYQHDNKVVKKIKIRETKHSHKDPKSERLRLKFQHRRY